MINFSEKYGDSRNYNAEIAIFNQLTDKLITDYENPEYILREPGEGAIDFARRYIGPGIDEDAALDILGEVIDGRVAEVFDKKVKRCGYCGHLFRDKTKNNSGKYCAKSCKDKLDYAKKKAKRKITSIKSGNYRKSFKDKYYYSHLEYPFWQDLYRDTESLMMEYDRKRGSILMGDDFERRVAQDKINTEMGGKKKSTSFNYYESAWSSNEYVPSPEFYGDTKPAASTVRVEKKAAGEIEQYMKEQYDRDTLNFAREKAIKFHEDLGADTSANGRGLRL